MSNNVKKIGYHSKFKTDILKFFLKQLVFLFGSILVPVYVFFYTFGLFLVYVGIQKYIDFGWMDWLCLRKCNFGLEDLVQFYLILVLFFQILMNIFYFCFKVKLFFSLKSKLFVNVIFLFTLYFFGILITFLKHNYSDDMVIVIMIVFGCLGMLYSCFFVLANWLIDGLLESIDNIKSESVTWYV